MTPLLCPLNSAPFDPILPLGTARSEREIITARLASARKWHRRRRVLRLRVTLFGRRKTKLAAMCGGPCASPSARPQSA